MLIGTENKFSKNLAGLGKTISQHESDDIPLLLIIS